MLFLLNNIHGSFFVYNGLLGMDNAWPRFVIRLASDFAEYETKFDNGSIMLTICLVGNLVKKHPSVRILVSALIKHELSTCFF
jgi:hypothetical protein